MAGGSRSAAPTLRYGPAGDSAPGLRLKAAGIGRKVPFRPATRPNQGSAPGLYGSGADFLGEPISLEIVRRARTTV